jgi:phosphatidylglycerol:prolipoprotein diacylglycerol transferase
VHPEIHLGPLTIQSFGLCVAIAFLAAGVLVQRRLMELGQDGELAYEVTGAALVGGIFGARLWWALGDWNDLIHDPWHKLFSGSGLVWYGGLIGGVLAVWAWAHWRKVSIEILCSVGAPALALGYALGRIGCQISGDGDYGRPSHWPWAMAYPHGVVPTNLTVHPTPIYETVVVGLIALSLWHYRDRLTGFQIIAWYLIATGIERVLVEIYRRNPHIVGPLTLAQLTSLVGIAVGIGLLTYYGPQRPRAPQPA